MNDLREYFKWRKAYLALEIEKEKARGSLHQHGNPGYSMRVGEKGELGKTEVLLYEAPQARVDDLANIYRLEVENEIRSKAALQGE